MYYGRRKAITITIIVIILILLLAAGGVFAYLKTDLLKSNEDLFFKYMGQNIENLNSTENAQLDTISKLKEQMPYELNGELKINFEEENLDNISKILSNMKVKVESKVDNTEDKTYAKTELLNNSESIFTVEYANSNNIYALKSDEVVTAFLGIENDNLKVLSQKLNIPYDAINIIPNDTKKLDINQLFNISEEEINHVKETYISVIKEVIPKEAYSKNKDIAILKDGITYNTTGYRLKLTEQQLKELKISILETLKEDSITLNLITTKAKLLGLGDDYTQINNLTSQIQKEINSIQTSNSMQQGGISITIYVENGEVITTEIIYKNDIKYTMYSNKTMNNVTRYLLIEKLDVTEEFNKIEIKLDENISSMESTINAAINVNDAFDINIYLENIGTAAERYLDTNCEVTVSYEDTSFTITYNQEMNFTNNIGEIIELKRNVNCGVLNDYTTEQLQYLMQSIVDRLNVLLAQKLQMIGLQ